MNPREWLGDQVAMIRVELHELLAPQMLLFYVAAIIYILACLAALVGLLVGAGALYRSVTG